MEETPNRSEARRPIQRLCVFCGSSTGTNAQYRQDAIQLGHLLLQNQIGLVYGGGRLGLMDAVAQTVREGGGHVTGIIPHALAQVSGSRDGEDVVVETMHERKAKMHELADAMVALPGGFGTLEELLETITWSQLRIHSKPVGLLNTCGYFDPVLQWMDKAQQEGFLDQQSRRILVVGNTPQELLQKLEQYQDPLQGGPWILEEYMWKKRSAPMSLEEV